MMHKLNSWSETSLSLAVVITISLYYETEDKLFYIEGKRQGFSTEDSICIELGTQRVFFSDKTNSFDRAFFIWWRAVTHHPFYQKDSLIKYVELRKARETMDAVKRLPTGQLYFDI